MLIASNNRLRVSMVRLWCILNKVLFIIALLFNYRRLTSQFQYTLMSVMEQRTGEGWDWDDYLMWPHQAPPSDVQNLLHRLTRYHQANLGGYRVGGGCCRWWKWKIGWEGHTLMLEIAPALLVCVGWESSYSQPHNGTNGFGQSVLDWHQYSPSR